MGGEGHRCVCVCVCVWGGGCYRVMQDNKTLLMEGNN